jgi:hypothetical protein
MWACDEIEMGRLGRLDWTWPIPSSMTWMGAMVFLAVMLVGQGTLLQIALGVCSNVGSTVTQQRKKKGSDQPPGRRCILSRLTGVHVLLMASDQCL